MPTEEWFKENPKVSGYISKTLYERLKRFASERSSSISQALTVVLAEYFGVNQAVDRSSVGGVTLAQFQKQQEELDTLNQEITLVNQRLLDLENRTDSIGANISLQVNQKESTEVQGNGSKTAPEIAQPFAQDEESKLTTSTGKLFSELISELPESNNQVKQQDANISLLNELDSRLIKEKPEEEVIFISEPSDEISSAEVSSISGDQTLTGGELGQRLGVKGSVITRYKNGKRKQSLSEWSKTLDPEGTAWGFSEELKKYVPVPIQDTSGSLTSNLLVKLPVEKPSSIKPKLEQKDFDGTPFTEEQLAARFGMTSKRSLSNQRASKQESFSEWSRGRDPDGVIWHYVQESKLYYPGSLPSQPVSSLLNFGYEADSDSSSLNESNE